jgi:hypothetical protein
MGNWIGQRVTGAEPGPDEVVRQYALMALDIKELSINRASRDTEIGVIT